MARPGQHRDPYPVVGLHVVPDLGEFLVHAKVHRVEHFGTVEGDVRDVVLLLVAHPVVCQVPHLV
jgi:hypothetical protein